MEMNTLCEKHLEKQQEQLDDLLEFTVPIVVEKMSDFLAKKIEKIANSPIKDLYDIGSFFKKDRTDNYLKSVLTFIYHNREWFVLSNYNEILECATDAVDEYFKFACYDFVRFRSPSLFEYKTIEYSLDKIEKKVDIYIDNYPGL